MLYIDGKWSEAASGRTFDVINPATGDIIGSAADGGAADARRAVSSSASAFESWSRTTAYERSAVLLAAHRILLERHEELARLMTTEQGKPLRMARTEVTYAADFLVWFAEEA